MLVRALAVLGCAVAAVLALTTGVAQAHIPPSQYHAAGYSESSAKRIRMGFTMPRISCAGMAKDSSVSIGIATAPFDEDSIPRLRIYARGYCEYGRAHYILFTEYARFRHQHVGLEFGLQPGDWVSIRAHLFAHHVHYYIHQQPDGNGNDLQGTLAGNSMLHPGRLLLGAVAAGPTVPWFGTADIHTRVDGGKRLTQIGAHRSDAHRAGHTVIHTTSMRNGGRRYALQFMNH